MMNGHEDLGKSRAADFGETIDSRPARPYTQPLMTRSRRYYAYYLTGRTLTGRAGRRMRD